MYYYLITALYVTKVVPNYYSEGDLWEELSTFTGAQKIGIASNTFSIYHDTEFRETDVDIRPVLHFLSLCAFCQAAQGVIARPASIVRVGGETMFRIGEFSKLTQVSIRMLRYYDANCNEKMDGIKFFHSQLKPIMDDTEIPPTTF